MYGYLHAALASAPPYRVVTPNAPDAPTVIASVNTQTGNGFSYPTNVFDISESTKAKQLVRFGFWFLTSSAGLKAARVQGRIKIKKN